MNGRCQYCHSEDGVHDMKCPNYYPKRGKTVTITLTLIETATLLHAIGNSFEDIESLYINDKVEIAAANRGHIKLLKEYKRVVNLP